MFGSLFAVKLRKNLQMLLTKRKMCGKIYGYSERYRSGHNEAVLKTVWEQSHKGSNPFLSAIKQKNRNITRFFFFYPRKIPEFSVKKIVGDYLIEDFNSALLLIIKFAFSCFHFLVIYICENAPLTNDRERSIMELRKNRTGLKAQKDGSRENCNVKL